MTLAAPCEFETTTGRPCVVCRSTTDLLAASPEASPDHPQHLALATAADLSACRSLLAERGLHLFELEIGVLPAADRAALDAWAATTGVLQPPGVERCHVAGPVAMFQDPRQACTRCHVVLLDAADVTHGDAYPVGAYVGLDCPGRPIDDAEAISA